MFDGECGRTNRTFIDDRNTLPWKKRGDAGGGGGGSVAIRARARGDDTLCWYNEDGSARSHSTLAQSQADPKVSTS